MRAEFPRPALIMKGDLGVGRSVLRPGAVGRVRDKGARRIRDALHTPIQTQAE